MSKLFIGLSLTTDNARSDITDRPEVMSLLNDVSWMTIDSNTSVLSSTKYLLDSIKAEKLPSFRFQWRQPEKYKNTFNGLKNAKVKFTLFLIFFYKDDNQKLIWSIAATAEKSTVFNVQSSGNSNDVRETVDINCEKFDYK